MTRPPGRPPRDKTMVEIVARALCLSKMNAPPGCYAPGYREQKVSQHWMLFIDDAKTSIAAMRKPTEAMIDAFYQTYPIDCGPIPIWESMIDEALK